MEGLTSPGKFHDISFSVRQGEILGFGQVRIESPPDAIALGIGLVPEDRKKQGSVLQMSCAENPTLSSQSRFKERGWLSGGNQQKPALGKWLVRVSRILILDEPTRGVDIAAKTEIHRLIHDLAQRGYTILLISSDLPELLALSTRILDVRRGRVAGMVPREKATEESILNLMMGAASESASNGTVPAMPLQTPTERQRGRIPSIRRPDGHVVTENRFLRGENLDKLAKNASFSAIMAIGANAGDRDRRNRSFGGGCRRSPGKMWMPGSRNGRSGCDPSAAGS